MAEAARVAERAVVPPPLPELIRPPEEALRAAARPIKVFKPKKFTLTAAERATVQPVLTPDNYGEHVVPLIQSAKRTLYFQNQYVQIPKVFPDGAGKPGLKELAEALRDRIAAGVDVRIILRNGGDARGMLQALKVFGIDPARVHLLGGCHNKGIVVDSKAVLVSSQNYSADGVRFNRDAGLLIRHAGAAAYFEQIFLHDWDNRATQRIAGETGGCRSSRRWPAGHAVGGGDDGLGGLVRRLRTASPAGRTPWPRSRACSPCSSGATCTCRTAPPRGRTRACAGASRMPRGSSSSCAPRRAHRRPADPADLDGRPGRPAGRAAGAAADLREHRPRVPRTHEAGEGRGTTFTSTTPATAAAARPSCRRPRVRRPPTSRSCRSTSATRRPGTSATSRSRSCSRRMTDKGLVVTLVLDCCHSGGATRAVRRADDPAGVRGVDFVDRTERPADSLVLTAAELAAPAGATRGLGAADPATGCVVLAACRPFELAREFMFDGGPSQGALTYWFLKLAGPGADGLTFRTVFDQAVARIHDQFPAQTPMLFGNPDRAVLGGVAGSAPRRWR